MKQLLSTAALLLAGLPVMAQKFDPPAAKTPDAETLKKIEGGTAKLREAVAAAVPKVAPIHRADLEIYLKAAEWIVKHNEWFTADSGKQTLAVIAAGIARAESAATGKIPWLEVEGRSVARGYRSDIDNSVQPYGVVYPVGYGSDKTKKWRLDISLHGRDSSLTEVKHLNQHAGRPAPKDQDFVQLNIYGRGNNAYRWAGESDVFEVIEHFAKTEEACGRKGLLDDRRMVLKGFSMGGAGTWHIGLRHPDRFAVIQPGAGFTNTHGYIANLADPLPDYQEKCLRIYDAYRYAENAAMVPIVAYSGEIDAQKKAADNLEAELKTLKLSNRMVHLIAPGLAHSFPAEWQKTVEREIKMKIGESGRAERSEDVRFVTNTLKQSMCEWVQIDQMIRHYEQAKVDASWKEGVVRVTTENVARLILFGPGKDFPKSIQLDGKDVVASNARGRLGVFEKNNEGWKSAEADLRTSQPLKKPGTQGPIDDAFTGPFLCVIGSGKPQCLEMHDAAMAQLQRLQKEWDKYMRGVLIVKKDSEVTKKDQEGSNLVLFGDPGSNSLLAEVLTKSPVLWTPKELKYGSNNYDPLSHLPMWIQPNPNHAGRYVVVNSGHTFHEAEFKGTNAQLYPRLGDFAVVKPTPTKSDPAAFEVAAAGLFDESWKFPKK